MGADQDDVVIFPMQNYRFLLPLLLVIYIFAPMLVNWIVAPTAIWYKPYLLWLSIIVSIYILQKFNSA